MSALTNGNRDRGTDGDTKLDRIDAVFRSLNQSVAREEAATAGRGDLLRRTIESEIIPRLMLTCGHPAAAFPERKTTARVVCREDVAEFTQALLDYSPDKAAELVDGLLASGASQHAILLDLFAPSARRLGEMWETDARNFAEVTLAMGALQQTLRKFEIGNEAWTTTYAQPQVRKIFLTPCAGEQHSFSVQLLEAFFSSAGWHVDAHQSYQRRDVEAFMKKRHFDIVGLSVSRDCLLTEVASDIDSIRRKSCNPNLVVLVGGRIFIEHPELVGRVGADATAPDAKAAVALANRLVPEGATAQRR